MRVTVAELRELLGRYPAWAHVVVEVEDEGLQPVARLNFVPSNIVDAHRYAGQVDFVELLTTPEFP